MKKLLAVAAMSALASLGIESANAGSFTVVCLKQGPRRGAAAPLRSLDVTNCPVLPASPFYPIPARSLACNGNSPEKSDVVGDMNFVSLGFGGEAILVYSDKFGALPGDNNDISLFETTWGDPACTPNVSETALVSFSQNGVNWTNPVEICHNGSVDIAPLAWGKYVKIVDKTNSDPSVTGDGIDAWDLDGVEASVDFDGNITNPMCDKYQGTNKANIGGMSGAGIHGSRKIFANANLGQDDVIFPFSDFNQPSTREVSGWYNFWSIGFGGYACFQLPYTVFDAAGPEFTSYETTWNNKPCPNYPETVTVQVSVDGVVWSAGRPLCKDGLVGGTGVAAPIDLADFGAGFEAVNYIKYTDASNPAAFGNGDDSYDIDLIRILQLPGDPNVDVCGEPGGNRIAPSNVSETLYRDGGVPEEMFGLFIDGANVVSDKISFGVTLGDEKGHFYSIRNHMGQEVLSGEVKGALYETPVVSENIAGIAPGVYFITLKASNYSETVRFVKK
jgi:hypothetical protein